jgi:hypothetical protein
MKTKKFESYSEDVNCAKILANSLGRDLSPSEFGEYIEDYYKNPNDYEIDTESDYYFAIETAWNGFAGEYRMPEWQKHHVENSDIYKIYKNL